MKVAGFLLALLLFYPDITKAQIDEESFKQLIQAKTLKCVWDKGKISTWKNGHIIIEDEKMKGFTFDSIDYEKGTARLIANVSAGDVSAMLTIGGITFMEQTKMGSVMFTTVYTQKSESMELRETFYAVHSRHVNAFIAKPISTQLYGKCMIWD